MTNKTATASLEHAAVGYPITRLGVSIFPIYLLNNDLPEIATGRDSGLVIEELPASTVSRLGARNPTDRPVLVPEGVQLVGGLQDRVLNTSVLFPPQAGLELPVTCLERGRWGEHRRFDRAKTHAPRRIRRAKNASVSESARRDGSRRSDQATVWNSIDQELNRYGVESRTRAMRDADQFLRRDRRRANTVEALVRLGPLPGQCGVVVAHGRRVVAVEVFGNHDLLVPHWKGLIRSYLVEPPTSQGWPSATQALRMLGRFGRAVALETPGVGLGVERHVNAPPIIGQVLTLRDAVVHASAFMVG